MMNGMAFAFIVLVALSSTAALAAVGITLVPNGAVFDSGQNVIYTVSATNIPINDNLNVGLYNIGGLAYQGLSVILSSPVVYNASVGYNSVQSVQLPAGYTYICAAGVNTANIALGSNSPTSWTPDTDSLQFGVVTSIGRQSFGKCSAVAGNPSGVAIEGIGLGGPGVPNGIALKSVSSAPTKLTENFSLAKTSPITVIMVALGGGVGPLQQVILSQGASNYCQQAAYLNNSDGEESVYMSVCTNLPSGSYGIQTAQDKGDAVSIGVYTFSPAPGENVSTFAFVANTPFSRTFSYKAVATDDQNQHFDWRLIP